MNKKLFVLVAALSVLLSVVGFAYAAEPGGAVVSNYADLGEYTPQAAGTVSVEAGNTYRADLDANQSTYRWVGVTGNATGTIILSDSANNVLYNWSAQGLLVYASTASTLTWSSLADATAADMPAYLTSGSDQYANTFTGTSENIGSQLYPTISSDFANTYDNTGAQAWKTYSLTDGTNLVWAGLVNAGGANNFRGNPVNYQMILPEDGTAGDTTAVNYYMWLELQ